MQVQKINNSVYPKQELPSPNFKAKGLDPEIIKAVTKDSKAFHRFLVYAGEKQGEALNILVTAFGTAIICPMFIRFNPFSKEDKQTRAYSAWRQPISAIIAVAAQLTITKWFNNLLALRASTGTKKGEANYKRADLRACPHERYLKSIIKLEHPEWDKEQISKEVKRRQIDAEKAEITKARRLMKDKVFAPEELLCQDRMESAKKDIFERFKVEYKDEIKNKFGKPTEDVSSMKLEKFFKKKLKEKAVAEGIDEITFVQREAAVKMEKEIFGEAIVKGFLREIVNDNNGINKVSEAISYCESNEGSFKRQLAEYIHSLKGVDKLEEKVLGKGNPDEYSAKIEEFASSIVKKLKDIKEYEDAHKLKDFTSIKDIGKSIKDIIHNVEIKKYIQGKNSDAKRVFKTMNTQLGLIVTLATLPITCGILNWAYPRIMEKIMPEMAAKKKATSEPVKKEGGDK